MIDYRSIFEKVESTLIKAGSEHLPADAIRARLNEFKILEGKRFTDAQYFS